MPAAYAGSGHESDNNSIVPPSAWCDPRRVTTDAWDPPYDRFRATAEAVAQERPEVDLEMAREVFDEVATLLYNGLVLDGLDDHDGGAVVDGLCLDLVAEDPAAAVRARSQATLDEPGDLHDPEGVSRTYLIALATLKL
jgi:hypothetical protein